jgi:hypothetical protein
MYRRKFASSCSSFLALVSLILPLVITNLVLAQANGAPQIPTTLNLKKSKAKAAMNSKKCSPGAINRSKCMIELIFEDLSLNYPAGAGGGGITKIQAISTNQFVISIAQEERTDQFTYDFDLSKPNLVSIVKKVESTKSY